MIVEGLPWTISLITGTTLFSFVIGNLLGRLPGLAARAALAAWR